MASITQTIPAYTDGISQQPDQFKNPGQVSEAINVIPEIQTGLVKRPGSKFIRTLQELDDTASFFHYYRDQTEQYIGQVDRNSPGYPNVKLWTLKDIPSLGKTAGDAMSVNYSATNTEDIKQYLKHSDKDQLQFLTINDYTYILNRLPKKSDGTNNPCNMTNDKSPGWGNGGVGHEQFAYVELKKTANARQYSLNFNSPTNTSDVTTVTSVTRVKNKETYPDHHVYNKAGGQMVRYESNGNDLYPNASPNLGLSSDATKRNMYTKGGPFHTRHWTDFGGSGNDAWEFANKHEGTCADTGTNVFSLGSTADILADGTVTVYNSSDTELNTTELMAGRANLVWRWTIKGVSGTEKTHNSGSDVYGYDYVCKYEYDIELLHGGEYWQKGDYIKFRFGDPYKGFGGGPTAAIDCTFFLEIEEVETQKIKAKISASGDGLIRPEPTAFDASMAVSSGTILGGMKGAIGSLLGTADDTVEQIGNGLYLNSANPFDISTAEYDLMNIITDEVNDISKLPSQCKHGYVVKVANSDSEEDDYFMKFEGKNGSDGPGSWQECVLPGIRYKIDPSTMPLQLVRETDGTFTIQQGTWPERQVGDNKTNFKPSFLSRGSSIESGLPPTDQRYINQMVFWRNRIGMLSGTNVILSQPGDDNITAPTFWAKTALTVSPEDCIDLSAGSDTPAKLFEGIETGQGLLLFSENQQFLLSAEAEVLNPDTAKLVSAATYNYNVNTQPISLGTTVAFLDNAGRKSRFFEATNIQRGYEPEVLDQSASVPNLLPKDINLVTNSRENTYVLFAVEGTNEVFGYRYFDSGEKRVQSAWFKWQLSDNIRYHTIIDDTYYVVFEDRNLVKFDLRHEDSTAFVNDYPIHLDTWSSITLTSDNYNADTSKTTFSLTGYGLEVDKTVYVLDATPGDDFGRYGIATVSGGIATLEGDWGTANHSLYVGYNFDMQVKLPTIYPSARSGDRSTADVNASLVIHRLKLSLGAAGVYETTLERVGKTAYTQLIESSLQDAYIANTTPWVDQRVYTIPTYERNKNLTVYLKSTHPSPATLYSMSWEGDYSNKFYQRAG